MHDTMTTKRNMHDGLKREQPHGMKYFLLCSSGQTEVNHEYFGHELD
jgi:hypothetical protein